ncbi:hypothetical protein ACFW34_05745 [Streptomyces sp. NPDC058848]|uniref:hypothetical protein n=2 Tax=Streptomyces TaxID=1883 RepID=UPI003677899C
MIWSAVLPEAAWRVMRTAGGRRAPHVMLLVGGLFVLGVLCGERAQAAEGVPSPKDVTGQVVDASPQRPSEEPAARGPAVPRGLRSGQDSPIAARAHKVAVPDLGLRHATEDVVRLKDRPVKDRPVKDRPVKDRPVKDRPVKDRVVEDRVVRPVVDVAEAVADGLGSAARAEVPPLEVPTTAPGLNPPGLTDPPGPGGLPELSGLPGRVVPVDPLPQTLPSVTEPAASDASDAVADSVASAAASGARPTEGAARSASAAYGPQPVTPTAWSAARDTTDRAVSPSPATTPSPAPARQSPTGDPDGALGAAGADHGTPRHGDAHAVTPHHGIPFRLVPGALVRADAAETRDRYRDIPVSPA